MLSVNEALSQDRDAVGIGRKGTIDKPYKLQELMCLGQTMNKTHSLNKAVDKLSARSII